MYCSVQMRFRLKLKWLYAVVYNLIQFWMWRRTRTWNGTVLVRKYYPTASLLIRTWVPLCIDPKSKLVDRRSQTIYLSVFLWSGRGEQESLLRWRFWANNSKEKMSTIFQQLSFISWTKSLYRTMQIILAWKP